MQEMKLKIDPHVHSKGISGCSHVSCREIIEEKKKLGYDGVILTNHCQRWYYPATEHAAFMERIIEEYRAGAAYAQTQDFQFWLGIEVTLHEPHYADWLLYGVTEEFLRQSPCLYALTQKQLFELCEEWGVVMIQAHPFRAGQSPCEPKYMHGLEINCTPGDIEKAAWVEAFAKEHNLMVTCGTDYHFVERDFFGGIFVDEACQSATDFAKILLSTRETEIFLEKEKIRYTFAKNDRK